MALDIPCKHLDILCWACAWACATDTVPQLATERFRATAGLAVKRDSASISSSSGVGSLGEGSSDRDSCTHPQLLYCLHPLKVKRMALGREAGAASSHTSAPSRINGVTASSPQNGTLSLYRVNPIVMLLQAPTEANSSQTQLKVNLNFYFTTKSSTSLDCLQLWQNGSMDQPGMGHGI